jgi:hypothetical protein
MRSYNSFTLIMLLAIGSLVLCCRSSDLVLQKYAADLVIDFSVAEEPVRHRASGILLSLSQYAPPDKYIIPLRPSLIRHSDLNVYNRAIKMGAEYMYLISDVYAAMYLKHYTDKNGIWPGDNNKWDAWEDLIKRNVTVVKNRGYKKLIWDIWNEPDIDMFWKRSREQFFETYKRAYEIIRNIDPAAVISGPNTAYFNAVFYMSALHKANVDAVCKSCWPEQESGNAISNCFNNSLDGLLDAVNNRPRAIWWVYAEYGNMRGNFVKVVSGVSNHTCEAIASYEQNRQKAYIIVGRYDKKRPDKKNITICFDNIPQELIAKNSVHVIIKRIPDRGRNILNELILEVDERLAVEENRLIFTLDHMGRQDAVSILID